MSFILKKWYFYFLGFSFTTLFSILNLYSGCAKFNADFSESEQKSLEKGVLVGTVSIFNFSNSDDVVTTMNSAATSFLISSDGTSVDTPTPVTPTPVTPTPVTPTPVTPTPDTPPKVCSYKDDGLDALKESILSLPDGEKSVGNQGCEAGLIKFYGSAYDQSGKLVKSSREKSGKTFIGVYCKQNNNNLALMVGYLQKKIGLRGPGIKTTHLCRANSNETCSPDSANYIGGFEYGSLGQQSTIGTSVVSDKNANEYITKIFTPGGKVWTDLDTCINVNISSPLIIEKALNKKIELLDPYSKNTFFDIKGKGNKTRISCVKDGVFLTLPMNGKINDINQLFGNHTVGPDGKEAANGFEALAKHDDQSLGQQGYGLIDPADKVFKDLRLWEDFNCDGYAQSNELSLLSSLKIKSINWGNYKNILETDKYRNLTKQRSLVFKDSGSYLRIFDVWFSEND